MNDKPTYYREYKLRNQFITALLALLILIGFCLCIPLISQIPQDVATKIVIGIQGLILFNAAAVLWLGFRLIQLLQRTIYALKCIKEGSHLDSLTKNLPSGSEISSYLQSIAKDIHYATRFAKAVGEGKLDTSTTRLNQENALGKALIEMQAHLAELLEEEQQRNWLVSGQAKFGEILRKHQNSGLLELSTAFIEALAHYLGARQGAVYILEEEEEEKALVLAAGFACSKHHQQRLAWQEGLVGASVFEQETICMDNVPEEYVQISSALGATKPKNILIVPIKHNGRIYGAVELAVLHGLPAYQIQFTENVCESFASTVEAATLHTTTKKLLHESQQITQELREKEETLQQNAEELLTTQQELNRKLRQIEQESVRTASIVQAINKTNAALELDLDGNIVDVNDMYLSLMEYKREELLGKPEKNFVSPNELIGQRYDLMWESIRKGAYNSGEFKRISKNGRELWLTGTYSPIFDIDGNPYKIVQFAQFTTEQKERELELISKIDALNKSVSLVEINLDGHIVTANPVFLQEFGFKRIELRNKYFTELLDPNWIKTDKPLEFWNALVEGGVEQKMLQMRTKTGEAKYFISSFSTSKNLEGHVYRFLAILLNITEEHNLREQLDGLLTEEKRKNAILEMQAETTDQFIEEISDILVQLEDRNNHIDLGPILQRKNLPIVEFNSVGDIKLVNLSTSKLLGIEASRLKQISLFDIIYFSTDEEMAYFKERIKEPELIQVKLGFTPIENPSLRFNAYLAPHFAAGSDNYYIVMMILSVENIEPEPLE